MSFNVPRDWVSMATVLDHLGITPPTLYRWIAAGLPSYQIVPRGRRYFVLAEVDEWINSRSTSPRPGQAVA